MADLPEIGVRAVIADKDAFISGIGEINQAVKDSGKSFNDSVRPADAYEKALGHFSDRFTKLNSNLNQAKGLIKDVNAQTKDGAEAASGLGEGFDAAATAAGAFAVAAAAIVVTSAIAWLDEMNGALSRMAAQMGITQAQAEQFAPAIRNLASTGLVDGFDQGAEAIQLVTEKLKGLSDNGGPDVQEIARQAAGMADAWNASVPQVVNGAQALINKFPTLYNMTLQAASGFDQGAEAAGHFTTVTQTNAKEVAKLTPEIQHATDALKNYTPVMDKHGKITAGSVEHYKNLNSKLTELQMNLKGATTTTQEWVSTATNAQGPVTKSFMSAKDALDLMTKAAQEGHVSVATISQEIQTAGGFFANAGFTAKETLQLIATGAQNGVTNVTGLGRAIDSFHKGIVNPPKGFNEALSEMGLSKVAAELRTNQISMSDAMSQVFDSFNSITDPLAADEAAMKLFGVRSDQLGGPEVLGALAHFKDALKTTTDAASNVANVMEDDGTLGTAIKRFGAGIKSWVEDGAQHAYDAVKGIQWDQIGKGIQDGIANIGPTLQDVWNTITTGVKNLWTGIQNTFNDAAANISSFLTGTAGPSISNAATTIWNEIRTGVANLWSGVQDAFQNAATSIGDFLSKTAGPSISAAWTTITGEISDAWNSIFGPGGSIATMVQSGIQKAVDIVNGLVGAVRSAFNAIAQAIISALQPALAFVQSVASAVGSVGNSLRGVASSLGIGGHAQGGDLEEGVSLVGEQGPELAVKHGGRVTIISNNQSKIAFQAMTQAVMPQMAAALGVLPQTSSVLSSVSSSSSSSTTQNNQRSFNVNMHGVKSGDDAVRRFATMNALRWF